MTLPSRCRCSSCWLSRRTIEGLIAFQETLDRGFQFWGHNLVSHKHFQYGCQCESRMQCQVMACQSLWTPLLSINKHNNICDFQAHCLHVETWTQHSEISAHHSSRTAIPQFSTFSEPLLPNDHRLAMLLHDPIASCTAQDAVQPQQSCTRCHLLALSTQLI